MRTCGISVRGRLSRHACDNEHLLTFRGYSNGSCVAGISPDPSGPVPVCDLLVLPRVHIQQDLPDPNDPTRHCPRKPRLAQHRQTNHKTPARRIPRTIHQEILRHQHGDGRVVRTESSRPPDRHRAHVLERQLGPAHRLLLLLPCAVLVELVRPGRGRAFDCEN